MQETSEKQEITLNDLEVDALKETANIGAGTASMALSKLLGRVVDLTIPEFQIMEASKLELSSAAPALQSSQGFRIGVYTRIQEGMDGNVLITMPNSSALNLISHFSNPHRKAEKIEETDYETIIKFGGIVCSSYLTGIAKFFQQKILYIKPNVVTLHGDSILDFLLLNVNTMDEVVLVKIGFIEKSMDIGGDFILVLRIRSIAPLVARLRSKV